MESSNPTTAYGVAQEEQSLGQKFEIDVELHTNLSKAGEQDDLSKTIDYGHIYDVITSDPSIPSNYINDKQYSIII